MSLGLKMVGGLYNLESVPAVGSPHDRSWALAPPLSLVSPDGPAGEVVNLQD